MKTLYLDLFSGISGDMFIGALLDLGLDLGQLERELRKLSLEGYHLHATRGHKDSIAGIKFDVHLSDHQHGVHPHPHRREDEHAREHEHQHQHGQEHTHEHEGGLGHEHDHPQTEDDHDEEHEHEPVKVEPEDEHEEGHEHEHPQHEDDHDHEMDHVHAPTHSHTHSPAHDEEDDHDHARTYTQIRQLIDESSLSGWVKEKSIAVFHRIAVAEGKIHGVPPEQVHFHEVGAVDSIIDIVGACIGLELLGKPRVLASQVVEGAGWVRCAHGRFPIPAPATLAILGGRGIALSQCEETHELVTPTGAALLAELVESFGPMRDLVAASIGFGLGTRDNQTRPNVLRAVLGEAGSPAQSHDWESDTIAVLETNLDDVNAEILGSFLEKALALGALDVFYTPVQMKKNRPGVLLTLLCAQTEADRFTELVLRQTSSFGVRRHHAERRKLKREFVSVQTPFGEVTVKLGRLEGRVIQAAPEFESCRKVAEHAKVPLKEVYAAALKAVAV